MRWFLHSLIFFPQLIFSQLQTSTAMSPPQLVQNVLLGTGVNVTNVVYTGDIQAIGQFTATGTNLGITSGIVMTTGTVLNNGNGPHGPNDDGGSGIDNSGGSSVLLNSLLDNNNNSTFNAAILEFDFQAAGDLVSFNYVFGSEEYLEYVGAGFNDVFGLFISGPGIVGNQNIAKLPNQTVVSIDNVNNVQNNAFYVDNGDGNTAPFNSSNLFIQYDGFTRVLTASSPVQCGQTYHLTIAIADVGDGILDSGIFLEAESLTSEAPTDISFAISQNFFGDSTIIAEGCTSADFVFSRTNTTDPISVNIVVSGTATAGVDYTNTIPTVLNLAAGQETASFSFETLVDGVVDDNETIIITFLVPDLCDGVIPQEFVITIREVEPISVTLENDTIFCDGPQSVVLTPVTSGGLEPISYSWSTTETSSSITVSPQTTQTYSVTVTDFCLNSTATTNATVFIPDLVPVVIQPIEDIIEECPNVNRTIIPVITGGSSSQFNYLWRINGVNAGTSASLTLNLLTSSTISLEVTDNCGVFESTSFEYIISNTVLIPEINIPDKICPGDPIELISSASLGLGAYSFVWSHSGETSSSVIVNPLVTTTYTVSISDECQTYSIPISTTVEVNQPRADFTFRADDFNMGQLINFNNSSVDGVSFVWDLGNGSFSTDENPSTSYNDIGIYDVTLIYTDVFGCIDTITKQISIGYVLYIPNTFTPDGNRFNNTFYAKSINIQVIEFEIFNRWGELVFYSTDTEFDWDGTYNGKDCPDGTYVYRIRYNSITNRKEEVKIGHVTLLR
jgi:gliding motility-associated-like protein